MISSADEELAPTSHPLPDFLLRNGATFLMSLFLRVRGRPAYAVGEDLEWRSGSGLTTDVKIRFIAARPSQIILPKQLQGT